MKVLRAIIKQSKYKPKSGLKKELYTLAKNGSSNEDVRAYFTAKGKIKQLSVVQSKLKESLLDDILTSPLYALPNLLRKRFKVWKKSLQTKILLQTNSKEAGIKLAIDTIPIAEQNEDFEVVHQLCKELINQFSIPQPNSTKYKKYRKKLELSERWIIEEWEAEKLYRDLWHAYQTKASILGFEEKITALEEKVSQNFNYKFRYFYYSTKSFYFQLTNQIELLKENNLIAYQFFNELEKEVHYAIPFNFLSLIIPYYIQSGEFAQAEININQCLSMAPPATFNWHKILIYQCQLGFYCNKPKIAEKAFKKAHTKPAKFDSIQMNENWHLIKGNLAFYSKIGRIDNRYSFRLRRWLNVTENQGNISLKVNLIIVELLHHLVDKNHQLFLERIEQIDSNFFSHLKSHEYKRTRYFLRMLKCVVKGNYHPRLTAAHAKKHLANLMTSSQDSDTDVMEREIVRYEVLWGEVINCLSKKNNF